MTTTSLRLPATALVAILLVCGAALADTSSPAELILPTDPRFNVFELSNSAGGHTYASSVGTVLLSFISKDQRYCRTARFPADQNVLLACREEGGWKIEATSNLSRAQANFPTATGGGNMQEVGERAQALMASIRPLDELEVIAAASKGWLDPDPVDDITFEARDILGKAAMVYRASKSYVDTGTVNTVYANASRTWTEEIRFKTAYVAPFEFRFEFRKGDKPSREAHFIAWRDRDQVRAWHNRIPDMEKDVASIQSALDAAAGISRDSSGMIPGLIFPGTKLGGDIVRLTSAVRLDDAQIDGVDCFQVQGFRWPNTARLTTVWIDKEHFLIRKAYEEQELKDATVKTTWVYKPAMNVPVEEEALRFDRPQS